MDRDVFLIGCRGLPASYGGYETFVEQLTYGKKNGHVHYHVACRTDLKSDNDKHFEYNDADCFKVYVPQIGPAQAIYYDLTAVKRSVKFVRQNNIVEPIFYILGCSVGPFVMYIKKLIRSVNGRMYINPDGHEWMRAKWGYFARKYLKYSEQIMVKKSDLVICDSDGIEQYIKKSYDKFTPKTIFIAYGANVVKSKLSINDDKIVNWYQKFKIKQGEYYLIVGRFVPENNYRTMISEFMKSKTRKDLVIITNYKENKFYDDLKAETNFLNDKRIKFVGAVYDEELLKKIREESFAYLHGHSVGGTNPSLLEALASTRINLLYNIGFNKEVAKDGALYWSLEPGNLQKLIKKTDNLKASEVDELDNLSTERITREYSWRKIIEQYENVFLR